MNCVSCKFASLLRVFRIMAIFGQDLVKLCSCFRSKGFPRSGLLALLFSLSRFWSLRRWALFCLHLQRRKVEKRRRSITIDIAVPPNISDDHPGNSSGVSSLSPSSLDLLTDFHCSAAFSYKSWTFLAF